MRRRALVSLLFTLELSSCARPDAPEPRPTNGGAAPLAPAAVPSASSPRAPSPAPEPPAPPPAAPAPTAPPPPEPGRADLDPNNDTVVAPPDPIADCDARLAASGAKTTTAALPLRKAKTGHTCGAPQVVVYRGLPEGARFRPTPLVTCGMALALVRFETVLQEEAERELGSRVTSISQAGTYNCREMARFDLVSEHSYANAIDLESFTLKDGRTVSVERHFGRPGTEPGTPESRFLRSLARRLYDEQVFSVVLTEYFDRLHRDHFHFDLARYRLDGTR